jgi:cytochrome b subunit of formate dehydrogenase
MTSDQKTYLRFELSQRIEHVLLIISFTTLAITGLVQKFPLNPVSVWIVNALSGVEVTRVIHRIAAIMFVVESLYHFVVAGYKLYVERKKATMLPGIKDVKDAGQLFIFNLGVGKKRPKMGRYNFMEKAEYWALIWGLILMGGTGFMLWNPIATAKILPGVVIPAAKVAHGLEAILAVLAILLWHFYNVHIKHWNWSMIRGSLTRHEMEEEHAEELEEIESGPSKDQPDETQLRKRKVIYFPVVGFSTVVLLVGLSLFLTFEETAIKTVPAAPGEVEVFVPITPTIAPTATITPTPAPTEEVAGPISWTNTIGALMEAKCVACHGSMGGLGLDTYANAMKGGESGQVIIPGDADNSSLVVIQKEGTHLGTFDSAELEKVIEWIQAGAIE